MGETFNGFKECLELRELGFPQKRKFQSMYYITPDKLICIDDLSCIKHDGQTDFEDVFKMLVFKPRIEDLLEESPWLHEFIMLDDGTWVAYSKVEEDHEFIKESGRQDKMIRFIGSDIRSALLGLWIAVKSRDRKNPMTSEEVEPSENQNSGSDYKSPDV